MRCIAFCVAKAINIDRLERAFAKRKNKIERQAEVMLLEHQLTGGHSFYFANGAVVTWNIPLPIIQDYLKVALPFCEGAFLRFFKEGYSYRIGEQVDVRPHSYFNVDLLTLEENDAELMLALSFALARSIKLKSFEQNAEELVDKCAPIIAELAATGKTKSTRSALQKINGQIVENKSHINLKTDYSYHPKYFWQHPNLEPYYIMLSRYLDIPQRVEAFNQKLETLNDIFTMLNDHLEVRHSHHLELIIIALIFVEILFGLLNIHL